MGERITINPLTRISGFLEIQLELAGHTVVNARSSGLLYRGFEQMLKGREPLDAIYFTERICGICSTAHSMAAALALEEALQVVPTENDRMVRDLLHAAEFLQNHLHHFYQYTLPDYVRGPEIQPLFPVSHTDYRLPDYLNREMALHYLEALQFARLGHEILAVLGGKAPHNHGIFVGGVTVNLDVPRWNKIRADLALIKEFVVEKMLPDIAWIAEYYQDYFKKGTGYGNLMSYGLFTHYANPALTYVKPGVYLAGVEYPFSEAEISENIYSAWYATDQQASVEENPTEANATVPAPGKTSAYSWIKAPRYAGYPVEVGPLARMWLAGEYRGGISAMDRTIARVLEVRKIIEIMENLLARVKPGETQQKRYVIPEEARGHGLTDTTRGALGHWLGISGQKITHYNIITPSGWNLSSEDSRGIKGVLEQALIGTEIADLSQPVEIGRIVRSFDPCVSCATHVAGEDGSSFIVTVL